MNPGVTIILLVVFLLTVVGIAYALTSSSKPTIAELARQKKTGDIIAIFQNFQSNTKDRSEALSALAQMATPDALDALSEALSHRDDPLWNQLLIELPKAGPAAQPYLTKAFRSSQGRLAVVQMMKSNGPGSARWVLPYLNDPSQLLQQAAVTTLEQIGWVPGKDQISAEYWIAKHEYLNCVAIGEPAVQPLVQALKNPQSVEGSVMALGLIQNPAAIQPLLNLCKNDRYALMVVRTLSKWKEIALPELLNALKNQDEHIRQSVVDILDLINWEPDLNEAGARYWVIKRNWSKCVEIGSPAVHILMELLQAKDISMRLNAIRTLGQIGDETCLSVLLKHLMETDQAEKIAIIEALGHFKHPQAVEAIIQSLNLDAAAGAARSALVEIGPLATNQLTSLLQGEDVKLRKRAAEILESTHWSPTNQAEQAAFRIALEDWQACEEIGPAAEDLLIKELANPETCGKAAQVLVNIDPQPAIIQAIITAIQGKPRSAQLSLVAALGTAGPPVVEPLLAALEQSEGQQEFLIQALGSTGDERAAVPLTRYLTNQYPNPIREITAFALGAIGTPAVDPIFKAMRSYELDPRTTGIALGMAGQHSRDRLIQALHEKLYDAQVLVYALGKIHDAESAQAIISILHGGQGGKFGQSIRATARDSLIEIGLPAVQPLIDALALYQAEQASFTPVLVKLGYEALDPLIAALLTTSLPRQRQALIEVLGDIGERKAISPLLEIMNIHAIHRNHINEALAKIQKRSGI